MADTFLHGVEIVEIDNGARPIQTARSSVIGLVGTAPNADPKKFPLNTPVLIAGRQSDAAGLGAGGTLADAVADIFDQAGAVIVVVRVTDGANIAATQASIIGGMDPLTGQYNGLQALLGAQSALGVTPRLIVAPGFSQIAAVATEMVVVADRLRGLAILDGPNTTDAAAKTYRASFGSPRAYLVDPWVKVFDTATTTTIIRPASARIAGVIAKSDNERGFWWSPSNREIAGIVGTARPVDFVLGDPNARANLLNENEVATIIREDGYRLWGNRTCSADPKWAFVNVRRTADIINDSILAAHMWAVDRNITRTYLEDVVEGVNAYLRHLRALGAIIDGKAWADPELNSAANIAAGKAYINFDFSANYPAEHITIRSMLVNDYLEEIIASVAAV